MNTYSLDVCDNNGRPWRLTAEFAGQRLWVADFDTLANALTWINRRSMAYGIDMGIPHSTKRRVAK
jgi:hypothetical protein